jgi:hypothetical protein
MHPECIAQIGNKWYCAHNNTICANMMHAIVLYDNIQGLSKSYDRLQVNLPRAELEVVGRFLSSGQHTYRFDCYSAAVLVVSLFQQTLPDDVEMLYIKETIFGVWGGSSASGSHAPLSCRTGCRIHRCLPL